MRPEDLLARLEAGYEYDPMYGRLCNERDQLKAENAKLRELLADVFCDFVRCDMALREHGRTYLAYTRYIDRMRELGVEV